MKRIYEVSILGLLKSKFLSKTITLNILKVIYVSFVCKIESNIPEWE